MQIINLYPHLTKVPSHFTEERSSKIQHSAAFQLFKQFKYIWIRRFVIVRAEDVAAAWAEETAKYIMRALGRRSSFCQSVFGSRFFKKRRLGFARWKMRRLLSWEVMLTFAKATGPIRSSSMLRYTKDSCRRCICTLKGRPHGSLSEFWNMSCLKGINQLQCKQLSRTSILTPILTFTRCNSWCWS